MDTNNRRPTAAQGAEPSVETGVGWRIQLPTDSRERIINKILETLKRHLPFSGQEGLEELKKIAVHFEEKIYTAAMSQSDYLRKISLKMLTMESKSQNTIPNSLPPNPSGNNNRSSDSGGDRQRKRARTQDKSNDENTRVIATINEQMKTLQTTLEKLEATVIARLDSLDKAVEDIRGDVADVRSCLPK